MAAVEAFFSPYSPLRLEKIMSARYRMYGWHLSYFAGKVRSYLKYKRVPFEDVDVNLFVLMWLGKRKTGVVAMPLLRTPDGLWMQDSSETWEFIESRFKERSILPDSPRQRFVSYWLEAWGDEWWIPIAMQTRWRHSENYPLFERDAGNALLPGWPKFFKRRVVARIANRLRGYLPAVGVRPEQDEMLMSWTHRMLDLLETHFTKNSFLLGEKPSLADFSLMGTMYGHLGRDPWPARELIAPRPNLRNWIDRMADLPKSLDEQRDVAWPANDELPETLMPILRITFEEFGAQIVGISEQVRALAGHWPILRRLPRVLQDVAIPLREGVFRRAAMPYTLWMAQRAIDVIATLPADVAEDMRRWLTELGGGALLSLDAPRLERDGLQARLSKAARGPSFARTQSE